MVSSWRAHGNATISTSSTVSSAPCISRAASVTATALPCSHRVFSPSASSSLSNRVKMSSDSVAPLPESRIVVGVGGISVDFLAAGAAYPKPDDKIRSTSLEVEYKF